MKFAKQLLVVALLATAGFATAAPVDQAPVPKHQAGQHKMPDCRPMARLAMHEKLHDLLNLRADQEPAWEQFVQATRPPMGPHDQHDQPKLSAPERADMMVKVGERHAAAVKVFYAKLTPAQKAVMDEFRPAGGPPGMPHDCDMGHKGPMEHGPDEGRAGPPPMDAPAHGPAPR